MNTQATESYGAFAADLISGGILTDPWLEGAERFATQPVVLGAARYRELATVAVRVAEVYEELSQLVFREQTYLDSFFELTPFQKLLWAASAPAWHGFARADLFFTEAGVVCCELNCDTPTGQAEAVLLNEASAPRHPGLHDPNAGLERAYGALFEAFAARSAAPGEARNVGILYPTELTEDLPLVRLYQKWLEARGYGVVVGSPYNLVPGPDGVPRMFGVPCTLLLRHYKTDWWAEREPVWLDDEPYADDKPLRAELGVLLDALLDERVSVVNPFGSVLPQNKKAMAFFWEHLDLFSEAAQETIRSHIPETLRLSAVHREQLAAEREDWVLKSDYGCEGGEVVVGRLCSEQEWELALQHAAPSRWIVQRYFRADEDARGEVVNYGLYVVAGEAAGVYCRSQKGPTDVHAKSVPCFVSPEDA